MPDTWPFAGLLPNAASRVAESARTREIAVHHDVVAPQDDELRTLVLRAKTGDAEAFGTLYDRYLDLVYRYVYFRVGSHPLAEDLTSETFLRALRRIADFTWQGRDFGAWLVTIARNLVADHFKSGRYRLEVSTAEILDVPLDGPHIPENAVVTAMMCGPDRKSTRLNSSHVKISYAVFCLKKKKSSYNDFRIRRDGRTSC